jgi:hypothetical protein
MSRAVSHLHTRHRENLKSCTLKDAFRGRLTEFRIIFKAYAIGQLNHSDSPGHFLLVFQDKTAN